MIEMISKRFVLLAVLIAAVIIVLTIPIVSAENIPSVASVKVASERPLPQLQFDNFQEKGVITGELSPGKNVQTTHGDLVFTSQNAKGIPLLFGSIIYHLSW